MTKLSVVLAVKNEKENLARCLDAIKSIADEIVIFDDGSTDDTIAIAKKYGAKVTEYKRKGNFHETKQKAIEAATGDWILQLDADEVVTPELAKEIVELINSSDPESLQKQKAKKNLRQWRLFERHQRIVEERDGKFGRKSDPMVAYFIPRRNMFLGKPLIHGGVYPDAAIRLLKKGKAYLPAKSVHEQMKVDGRIGWLFSDLEHFDSPTLRRYLDRANRYTDLTSDKFKEENVKRNLWNLFMYTFYKPVVTFSLLFFRHLGFLDGIRGFLWAFFSGAHHTIAYWKYYASK